ncbi:AAA family ATPase [Mastigocoleus sp. MO_188.B34]|uniref:AAA family ATPase n=1 Tax=Mastigocoleus sp. MO_188.B34 TaxID=3036635 RepID=UPI002631B224|nr:AAA family ATPase [Mastigocoleus sp. MO_188.B34]MDJ0693991.1 AAA family ATPase [Mastigocoleus sp. MO_188.B34]
MTWIFPHCPTGDNLSIDWSALEREFDCLAQLAHCPQDKRFHAEGDVLTHTKLVCEALVNLSEWQMLPEQKRSILFAAALLHDIGKPSTTQIEEDGTISSKGHVLQGVRMTQQILWDLGVPFHCREEVVNLVKYGSLPLWFWDKPNPEKAVIQVSQFVSCDMLAMLAEADVKGRYCGDRDGLLELIEFFREFCRENDCFDRPRSFLSSHSRFVYFHKENADPNYRAYDDTRFQVTMMSGLPGSGKDTWIKENCSELKVISLDELRRFMGVEPTENQGIVANRAKAIAKEYMRNGESFVWNATNINRQLRDILIRLFTSYQARIRIVYLETAWEELLQRNKTRIHKVPEKVLYKMRNRLDVPKITEAHEVEWVISATRK